MVHLLIVGAGLLLNGAEAKEETERERMVRAMLGRDDAVLPLGDGTFKTLARPTASKTYSLALFFTAKHLEGKEGLALPQLRSEFRAVAQSYRREHGKHSSVFFGEVEFNDAQSVFASLGVESLPHMLVLPEHALPLAPDGRRVNVTPELRLTERGFGLDKNGMSKLVAEVSGQGVNTVRRDSIRDSNAFPLLLLAAVALAGAIVYKAYYSKRLRTATPWLCLSLAVYWFSVSGSMFTIIRNVPMFTVDRKSGAYSFFTSQFGVQLGAEGLCIGGLYLAAALAALAITHGAPLLQKAWLQRAVVYSSATAMTFAAVTALRLYVAKTGYGIRVVGFDGS